MLPSNVEPMLAVSGGSQGFVIDAKSRVVRLKVMWWGGYFSCGEGTACMLKPPMTFAASIHLPQQALRYALQRQTTGSSILETVIGWTTLSEQSCVACCHDIASWAHYQAYSSSGITCQ